MRIFTFTIILIFLVIKGYASEESLIFRTISTAEGLSQNTVRSVIVDQEGFVWAGTFDGLNRFDGVYIKSFKPEIGNISSISDHRINDIYLDRDGLIWTINLSSHFSMYDPHHENFINQSQQDSLANKSYGRYYEAQNGDIYFWGATDGCLKIKKTTSGNQFTVSVFDINTSHGQIASNDINFLQEDKNHDIWIGGPMGISRITQQGCTTILRDSSLSFQKILIKDDEMYVLASYNTILSFTLDGKLSSKKVFPNYKFIDFAFINDSTILCSEAVGNVITYDIKNKKIKAPLLSDPNIKGYCTLNVDSKKGVWLHNHTGYVWYFAWDSSNIEKFALIPPQIISVIDNERYRYYIDHNDIIWITTYGNGLFRYDPKNKSLKNYTHQNGLSCDFLLSIAEDKFGNLWIGTDYTGMIQVVPQQLSTHLLQPENDISIGKSNNVKVIHEDAKKNIWVGTKNGSLYLYDSSLNTQKCIGNKINPYTIIEDSQHRIWIGTKGNGIYIYDIHTASQLAHITTGDNLLTSNSIFHLLIDKNNRIWVATMGGGLNMIEEYAPLCFKSRYFFNNQSNKRYLRCLMEDNHGDIWIGSNDGVIQITPDLFLSDSTKWTSYQFDINEPYGISCNDIKTIYQTHDSTIWIGTAGGGMNQVILDSSNQITFKHYKTTEGLGSDIVCSILEDSNAQLWVSTEKGLSLFNPSNHTFQNFSFFSGSTNTYNENSCTLRYNGDMLWGNLNGIILLKKHLYLYNESLPNPVLTDFLLFGLSDKDTPISESITTSSEIELPYNNNTFTIRFASLNLSNPEGIHYSYILEPYDQSWSLPTSENSATYKNMPSGNYTFRVNSINSDGIPSEATNVSIIINPPFWRSNWAIICYWILFVIIVYICLRIIFKFYSLRNEIKIEKQLTNYKLRFFTNISHEFRTPLTLISGAIESLNQEELPSEASRQLNVLNKNTRQMTRLIDQLLEFRKIQNNVLTLNLEMTDITLFAREIYMAFNEMAEQKQISYTFEPQEDLPSLYLDKGKVDKILFNLLNNAFKFTPANGKITLAISASDTECLISVKDSGVGIPKEKRHLLFSRFMQINFSANGTGVGLSLVKEFTEVHKGRIWYDENENGGSIFNVALPLLRSAYADVDANFIEKEESKPNADIITDESLDEIPLPIRNDMAQYRVLIIDDNYDILQFLAEKLSQYFLVETANNGNNGLKSAIDNTPDLIVCDVMMPDIDGFEVTRRLRNDFQTCHIPIILLTAYMSENYRIEGIESGADAYITKPFNLQYLLSRIIKLIEQRETLKKRFSTDTQKTQLLSENSRDKEFFALVDKILDDKIKDPNFSVDDFAELSGIKRTLFYKKIKGLTGYSPNELIKIKRMKIAAHLLLTENMTISEVAWNVGIEDPFYFSKCFKAHFKCTPSKYKNQQQNTSETVLSPSSEE